MTFARQLWTIYCTGHQVCHDCNPYGCSSAIWKDELDTGRCYDRNGNEVPEPIVWQDCSCAGCRWYDLSMDEYEEVCLGCRRYTLDERMEDKWEVRKQ